MKVVRLYDDKEKLYGNIQLTNLCSAEVLIEYCTFRNSKRLCIVLDEANENPTSENWNFNPDNEYYVFLDTLWDRGLVDELELISDRIEMPQGLISQLGNPCISKVVVYTTYDQDEGNKVIETLKGRDELVNKLVNNLLVINTFQPDKAIYDIRQELE